MDTLTNSPHGEDNHRFLEWLEGLPPWDNVERLPTLLHDAFGSSLDEKSAAASTTILVEAVRRTYEPGCISDTTVVLRGPHGVGKSAFLRALLHLEHWKEWLYGEVSISQSPKEFHEVVAGRVIVELADLGGLSTQKVAPVEALLARTHDCVHVAYTAHADKGPRQFIIVATSTGNPALPDSLESERRFCVVDCREGRNMKPFIDPIRDQLWAEAMEEYRRSDAHECPSPLL